MTMLLGLVHVNMGPLSRPQALAEAAPAAEAAAHTSTIRLATGTAGRVLSIVTDRANAELAGPDLS